jgi:hypothetical protein
MLALILHDRTGLMQNRVNKFIQTGRDYKLLNDYILKINQLKDLEGFLCKTSDSLKHILNYDFFSFALKKPLGDLICGWTHVITLIVVLLIR